MPEGVKYGYILVTTHGDHAFATDDHHEAHPGGFNGWAKDAEQHVLNGIRILESTASTIVHALAIYENIQGQRGNKIADYKK